LLHVSTDQVTGAKVLRNVLLMPSLTKDSPSRRWEAADVPEVVYAVYLRLFQHTELEHTPKPLPTGYKGIPFIIA